MDELFRRAAWIIILICLVVYAVYIYAGGWVSKDEAPTPIIVLDNIHPNMHNLSGMVTVQSPCDELSVRAEAMSTSSFMLLFSTWREPSVTCDIEPYPRYFQTQFFAPAAGINIYATLDGKPLPIDVITGTSNDTSL